MLDKLECNESILTAKTTNGGGGEGVPVGAEISDLTNTDKKGSCPSGMFGSCAITAIAKPWTATFEQSGILGNGDLKMVEKSGGGTGPPRFQFVCFGGINCIYAKKEILMRILGGNLAWTATATNQIFEKVEPSSFFCPAAARWNAMYESGKPTPLWVSKK